MADYNRTGTRSKSPSDDVRNNPATESLLLLKSREAARKMHRFPDQSWAEVFDRIARFHNPHRHHFQTGGG